MTKLWSRVSDTGVEPGMEQQLVRKINIANQVAMLTIVTGCVYSIAIYLLGYTMPALMLLFVIVALGATIILNRNGMHTAARIWLIAVLNISVTVYAWVFGKDSGVQLVLLSNLCLPWLLFRTKETAYIVSGTLLAIVCYYVFIVFFYDSALVKVPATVLHVLCYTITGIAMSLLVFYMYFHASRNERTEAELNDINTSLKKTKEQLEQSSFEGRVLMHFSAIARENTASVKQLCEAMVRGLMEQFACSFAAVFVYEKGRNKLELICEMGGDSNRETQREISPGETLVGQVFKRGETMYLKNLPPGYVRVIRSGTGSIKTDGVLIVPLKFNDRKAGVIELAGMSSFAEADIRLLERIAESFAASVVSVKGNMEAEKNVHNLEQLRARTDTRIKQQYQSQHDAMVQMMEKFKRREKELLEQVEILRKQPRP